MGAVLSIEQIRSLPASPSLPAALASVPDPRRALGPVLTLTVCAVRSLYVRHHRTMARPGEPFRRRPANPAPCALPARFGPNRLARRSRPARHMLAAVRSRG